MKYFEDVAEEEDALDLSGTALDDDSADSEAEQQPVKENADQNAAIDLSDDH